MHYYKIDCVLKEAVSVLFLFLLGVVISVVAMDTSTTPFGLVLVGIIFIFGSLILMPTLSYLLVTPHKKGEKGFPVLILTAGSGAAANIHGNETEGNMLRLCIFIYCVGLVFGMLFAFGLI